MVYKQIFIHSKPPPKKILKYFIASYSSVTSKLLIEKKWGRKVVTKRDIGRRYRYKKRTKNGRDVINERSIKTWLIFTSNSFVFCTAKDVELWRFYHTFWRAYLFQGPRSAHWQTRFDFVAAYVSDASAFGSPRRRRSCSRSCRRRSPRSHLKRKKLHV